MVKGGEAEAEATDKWEMGSLHARNELVACGSEGISTAECIALMRSQEQRLEISAGAGGQGASSRWCIGRTRGREIAWLE